MRFAIGSLSDSQKNAIQVVELNEEKNRLEKVAEVAQTFPPTKLTWKPGEGAFSDTCKDGNILAATSTKVELFHLNDGELKSLAKLPSPKTSPPITSLDWSSVRETRLATSSVDTTITIYDLVKLKIETQLIAHDKAVFDIAMGQRESIASLFCSCGQDGSIRLFDDRKLEHSNIMYDHPNSTPLLRLAWNRIDKNYLATFGSESTSVTLLDLRKPSVCFAELQTHGAFVNAICWAPHTSCHLMAGCDDGGTLIWDVTEREVATALKYDAQHEVQGLQWAKAVPDHVALGTTQQIEVLHL